MEKHFTFNSGEKVNLLIDFNSENNTFLTHMIYIGEDGEEKKATMSFPKEEDRDTMFENYNIQQAEQFADFIKG
jgi:hypothetical protein